MAKGKYYTPEFKEQAVKMVVGHSRRIGWTCRIGGPVTHRCQDSFSPLCMYACSAGETTKKSA